IDRRGFLSCMAWVGTGLVWAVRGGLLSSRVLGAPPEGAAPESSEFTFVQVSDSHIGFGKEPNSDVTGTFREAIARIDALERPPAFILHTGDLTHLSKPAEFDTVSEVLKGSRTGQVFTVPGEHDFFSDDGKAYLERHGKGTRGLGWQSFDY